LFLKTGHGKFEDFGGEGFFDEKEEPMKPTLKTRANAG
jgi:hypothetical protein